MSSTTAADAWIALTIKASVTPDEAAAAFAALPPVTASFLTGGAGEWQGADLATGHPTQQTMLALHWAGKTFRSAEDVDPIVVYDGDADAKKRRWNQDWGHARLREMKFGNGNTVAMLYDDFPIIDYFHYVNGDLVAGAMDSKKVNSFGTYYFYLKRLS